MFREDIDITYVFENGKVYKTQIIGQTTTQSKCIQIIIRNGDSLPEFLPMLIQEEKFDTIHRLTIMEKVAKDCRMAEVGSLVGKNSVGKTKTAAVA